MSRSETRLLVMRRSTARVFLGFSESQSVPKVSWVLCRNTATRVQSHLEVLSRSVTVCSLRILFLSVIRQQVWNLGNRSNSFSNECFTCKHLPNVTSVRDSFCRGVKNNNSYLEIASFFLPSSNELTTDTN